jgi:hypothetical protein
MPRARLTSEQLAEITARKGYSVSGGSLPVQVGCASEVPVTQCGAGDGPLAKEEAKEHVAGRFLVRFKIFRRRILDADNCAFGIKVILDCVRRIGCIPDDRPQDIRLEIAEQIKVETDEEERIEISVFGPDSVEAKQANQKQI